MLAVVAQVACWAAFSEDNQKTTPYLTTGRQRLSSCFNEQNHPQPFQFMPRYCLALDLKNDPTLIAEYEKYHEKLRPEIEKSIISSGITNMEIYRIGNRLFMIMETTDDFSFEEKATADAANPKVQEWENLMWTYQQALPMAQEGEKWMLMKKIFSLVQEAKPPPIPSIILSKKSPVFRC